MNGRLLDTLTNDISLDPVTHSVRRAASFKEKVMRNIGTVLRTFQGECYTNPEAGVPWFDEILGSSVLFMDEISQELKDKILDIDGVEEVQDIVVEIDGRNVNGKYKVILSDGSQETGEF